MTSTRNRNTPGDYAIQQSLNSNRLSAMTMESFGQHPNYHFAGNGLLRGHVGPNELAHNSTDVESMLFGIGSSNMDNPEASFTATPHNRPVSVLSISNRLELVMPDNWNAYANQRPYP